MIKLEIEEKKHRKNWIRKKYIANVIIDEPGEVRVRHSPVALDYMNNVCDFITLWRARAKNLYGDDFVAIFKSEK